MFFVRAKLTLLGLSVLYTVAVLIAPREWARAMFAPLPYVGAVLAVFFGLPMLLAGALGPARFDTVVRATARALVYPVVLAIYKISPRTLERMNRALDAEPVPTPRVLSVEERATRQAARDVTDHADPHGGMTCQEVEDWADDMCGDINDVSMLLARRGYITTPPDDDLQASVVNALHIAAMTGQTRWLAPRVPEEWFT